MLLTATDEELSCHNQSIFIKLNMYTYICLYQRSGMTVIKPWAYQPYGDYKDQNDYQ